MSRTIIIALFIVVAVATCSALRKEHREPTQAECKTMPNKVWVPGYNCGKRICGSKATEQFLCLEHVELGCACKRGYWELPNGDCVLEKDCPK